MTKADFIRAEIPGLRRYARAVTGSRTAGDALVKSAIAAMTGPDQPTPSRLDLYRRLDARISAHGETQAETGAAQPAAPSQRALLLVEVEGFSDTDTADILRLSIAETQAAVALAHSAPAKTRERKVFIIEDEPLIAAHVAEIVREMGHIVLGMAATAQAARAACRTDPPDLILSDMVLGEDSSGSDVAAEIASALRIPVVYITAHPQALLKGQQGEPAYLVAKPFRADTVRTVIKQALLQQPGQRTV